ncbi:hypothetical protein FNV43_RR22348 [Rhamnella rubrinervis]|uniref:Uncharacterized protein n=1 Tax=Rhamnella rubrinervis TaxID=2594499 RepID=A0A8K0DRE1_9ROSA|nr:hypothetical protein FNV43_RR22348 [Rhamnella rubrinervis]
MALTNFILTVAGVSAVVLLLRSDVKQSAAIFRRNTTNQFHLYYEFNLRAAKAVWDSLLLCYVSLKTRSAEKTIPKELESKVPQKDIPKEDKH